MTAVSLVAINFELSGFYEAYDGFPATDDCIKACWEAWEIMELVENSDTEAAFVKGSLSVSFCFSIAIAKSNTGHP